MQTRMPGSRSTLGRRLLPVLLAGLCGGLALTILSLSPPGPSSGLADEVTAALAQTGVTSPVTAVLLDFRGYDTLLEMAVLLLALGGVWSLVAHLPRIDGRPGIMLDRLTRLYLPLMLVVAGYLLWAGGTAPGGAFQSGAVLGAAGVVLTLGGWRLPPRLAGWPLRLVLTAGLVIFIAVGLLPIGFGSLWLDYPRAWAGGLILLIETTASLSIGATLAALFLGGQPRGDP
ncbi:MAG: sodium:proton antiporter [Chromatiaceae bacterium]|nr:sodium:proton antiporter [Candidatus Thioaporhodococcus sediminis]